jgi:hypothetical protein
VRRGLGVGVGTNVLAMHNGVRPVRLAACPLVSGSVMLYAGAANVPGKVEEVRTAMLAAAGKVKLAGRADR